jgi:hypothetical protein
MPLASKEVDRTVTAAPVIGALAGQHPATRGLFAGRQERGALLEEPNVFGPPPAAVYQAHPAGPADSDGRRTANFSDSGFRMSDQARSRRCRKRFPPAAFLDERETYIDLLQSGAAEHPADQAVARDHR